MGGTSGETLKDEKELSWEQPGRSSWCKGQEALVVAGLRYRQKAGVTGAR